MLLNLDVMYTFIYVIQLIKNPKFYILQKPGLFIYVEMGDGCDEQFEEALNGYNDIIIMATFLDISAILSASFVAILN